MLSGAALGERPENVNFKNPVAETLKHQLAPCALRHSRGRFIDERENDNLSCSGFIRWMDIKTIVLYLSSTAHLQHSLQ
jgi:hypothetical protein